MDIIIVQVLLGYVLDLVLGDPSMIPHPVVIIGNWIARLEKLLRKHVFSPAGLRIAGAAVAVLITAGSYIVVSLILLAASRVNFFIYMLIAAWLISTTIANRGLACAAKEIKEVLVSGNLGLARVKVSWIVGRDTSEMDPGDVTRATVETVAENLVDAVVAPIFYALIGGPALAMAYRAVNTLDSMLGYKNEKYLYFGWASARLDDIAGYIPARLAGMALLIAAWITNRDNRSALAAWRRDAELHPSPNSGVPESVMAGALGIRLGGRNSYGGVVSFRHYMGENREDLRPDHIARAVEMLYLGSFISLICCCLVRFLIISWRVLA
ncbi:adenosylcobinamide-phosphate synthase CbiB [Desulfotruncus alcoholivorax]|uniref:adenosylcobinamide-phosphate synthase CbiB n=1 Tax=Desulfotruncus alcoholivorax TaxID=265477 RepID=UPI00040BC1B9|nr:adenosylcobinamide-phosphate synthase CbiB [Desulfotruncus alcoholivorax]